MPPPTSGEILLPPGVYRHGGNPILEETRSLACIPETRRQPQIKLPRGQWLLPLGFCPRTPESLDLLLCCSPSPTVSRGCCVLASGPGPRPALPSPTGRHGRHGQPGGPVSPVWPGACLQPGSSWNKPPHPAPPQPHRFHNPPAGPILGISCTQARRACPTQPSLARPRVSLAQGTVQELRSHHRGDEGPRREAREWPLPQLREAPAARWPALALLQLPRYVP